MPDEKEFRASIACPNEHCRQHGKLENDIVVLVITPPDLAAKDRAQLCGVARDDDAVVPGHLHGPAGW